jgi:hypothetical protein
VNKITKKTILVYTEKEKDSSPHERILIHNPHPTNKITQPENPPTRKKGKETKTRPHCVKNVYCKYLNRNPKAQPN